MTVPSSSNRMEYTGNGVASVFDYTFQIFDNTDLQVYVLDTDGVQTQLVLTTDFTVTGAGDPDGGSITLVAGALTTDYELTILREVPLTQEVDLRNQGAYYPETVETMGDRLMMGIQQLAEKVSRTLQFRPSDNRTTPPRTNQLPVPQSGFALAWDADGNLENVTLATINYDIIIAGGDAGKVIKVNATEDGIDVGVTYTDANTVSTIIQRDAAGRAKVSNPSAAQDIATKDYVDNVSIATANIQDEAVTSAKLAPAIRVAQQIAQANVAAAAALNLPTVFADNPFDFYMVVLSNVVGSATTTGLQLQVTDDSGATYETSGYTGAAAGYSLTASNVNAGTEVVNSIAKFQAFGNLGDGQTYIADITQMTLSTTSGAELASVLAEYAGATLPTGFRILSKDGVTLAAQGTVTVYGSNIPF